MKHDKMILRLRRMEDAGCARMTSVISSSMPLGGEVIPAQRAS
jgi:hypothetical protein